MRIPRIFQEIPLLEGTKVTLTESGSHHVTQVLRMKPGDQVLLFNGTGGEYFGEIEATGKRGVEVLLTYFNEVDRASPLSVHLGQVIGKGERFDYAIQKAVELGVTEITPLFSRRCEVKLNGPRLDKKLQQWKHLAVAACEQSGLNIIPQIHAPVALAEWAETVQADARWILHTEGEPHNPFTQQAPQSLAFAVGPEGGFEDTEVSSVRERGFDCVSMGPRIWRTETAPVVMLSLLQYHWGDLRDEPPV
ncbi:Protein of unknown function (DUF558) [gamma proteobacterium HdN1]|nr:Protein of unknown function (DUF558) [gamma proteobacterium HdN1]